MQVNKKKIPEKFYCERCQPRATNVNRAKLKQHKFLKRQSKKASSSSLSTNNNNNNNNNGTPSYKTQTSKLIDIENDSKTNTDSENSSDENNNTDSENSSAEYEELNIETPDSFNNSVEDRLHEKIKATNSQKKSHTPILDNKENKELKGYEHLNEDSNSNDSVLNNLKQKKQAAVAGSEAAKKTSRNQYSTALQALQTRLSNEFNLSLTSTSTLPSSSSGANNNNNKSTVSSLLQAAEFPALATSPTTAQQQSVSDTFQRHQTNKRGSLSHLIHVDCLRVIKPTANSPTSITRVKSNQQIKKNQLLGEYCGHMSLQNEYSNNSNPFQLTCQLTLPKTETNSELSVLIRVDSGQTGTSSRFMRKSCEANCQVRTLFDTNNDLHLLIAATKNISKNTELTLPFDFFDLTEFDTVKKLRATGVNFGHCVCQCEKKNCLLREAISDLANVNSQNLNKSVKVNKEESIEVEVKPRLRCELKVETKCAEEMVNDVKKKSPGASGKQRQNSQSNGKNMSICHEENDELNKSLVSRGGKKF